MPEVFANDAITSLASSIGANATSLIVISAIGFPSSGNFRIRIDNEILLVTSVSGTTWTVTRAVEAVAGTTLAASHSSGAQVTHVLTAASVQLASPGGATGIGTVNTIPKVTNATGPVYGDSSISDNGTTVTITEFLSLPWGSGTSFNVRLGASSGNSSGTGDYNTAIGYTALAANSTGNYNTAIGNSALHNNTSGYYNVAIGAGALAANTTGYHNISLGTNSLNINTSGAENAAIGYNALYSNVTGTNNVAIGSNALFANTNSYNTAIGPGALAGNTSGSVNTSIGASSAQAITTGSNNTIVGGSAGSTITSGSQNTLAGTYANASASNTQYGVALGYVAICGSNEFALSPYVTQQTLHGRSSTFTDRKVGSFTWGFDVSTDASYQGYLNILGWDYNGVPYTVISVGGNGSAGTLGFFKATKVIQQNTTGTGNLGYTANVSANGVYAQSTFTGGVGSTAYDISDIVLALKNYGLLAN